MRSLLERIFRALQERGVHRGFQLIVRIGETSLPAVCVWAAKPPVGLGETVYLYFNGEGPLDEAAAQVSAELGVPGWENLIALADYLRRLLAGSSGGEFEISFTYLPGFQGPKIWLNAGPITAVSYQEDPAQALGDIFRIVEKQKAAL